MIARATVHARSRGSTESFGGRLTTHPLRHCLACSTAHRNRINEEAVSGVRIRCLGDSGYLGVPRSTSGTSEYLGYLGYLGFLGFLGESRGDGRQLDRRSNPVQACESREASEVPRGTPRYRGTSKNIREAHHTGNLNASPQSPVAPAPLLRAASHVPARGVTCRPTRRSGALRPLRSVLRSCG